MGSDVNDVLLMNQKPKDLLKMSLVVKRLINILYAKRNTYNTTKIYQ